MENTNVQIVGTIIYTTIIIISFIGGYVTRSFKAENERFEFWRKGFEAGEKYGPLKLDYEKEIKKDENK